MAVAARSALEKEPIQPIHLTEEFAMRKALVPVDGSAAAHRAVRHIVSLASIYPSIEAVLLNVQPEVDEWRVRRVLKKEEIEAEWAVLMRGISVPPAPPGPTRPAP